MRALATLFRLHTAGWEVFVFLLGPLVVGELDDIGTVATLAVLGVMISSFIFVLNDLADLPRDRLDPGRQASPLVSGAIEEPVALALSCGLPVAMWFLIALDGWTRAANLSFSVLLGLGVYLDVFQKTSRRFPPLLLDVLFSVAMAGPVIVGVAAVREPITPTVWLLAASFLLLCLALNSVSGNLKDIASDLRTGFRTVAVSMGVRVEGERIAFSPAYRHYAHGLGAAMAAVTVTTAFVASDGWGRVLVTAVVALLAVGVVVDLHQIVSGQRPPSERGRERFFAFGMLQVVIITAALAPPIALAAAVTFVAVWELSFRLYWLRTRPRDEPAGADVGQWSRRQVQKGAEDGNEPAGGP